LNHQPVQICAKLPCALARLALQSLRLPQTVAGAAEEAAWGVAAAVAAVKQEAEIVEEVGVAAGA
jgi:hypothetical protein